MNADFREKFEAYLTRIRNSDPDLIVLNMINKGLNDEDIIRLNDALAGNSTITTLNFCFNKIGPEGAKALAGNSTITTLIVSGNQIGSEGAKDLAGNSTITTLNVGENQIGPEGAKDLAQNRTIKTLNVGGNQIGPEGAKDLAQNRTITTLNAYCNQIGDAGAKDLAQNRTITTLNVGQNQIGAEGAQALAQNSTITTLDLVRNQIRDAGAQALSQNSTIKTLNVECNEIGPEGAQALAQNSTITTLHFNFNQIGDEGAQALSQNRTITNLGIASNRIGPAGAQALEQNRTITSLWTFSNQIGDAGEQALGKAGQRNRLLRKVGEKLYQQYSGASDVMLSSDEKACLLNVDHPEHALEALEILYHNIKASEPDKVIMIPEDLAARSKKYVSIDIALDIASKASDVHKEALPTELKNIVNQVNLSSSLRRHGVCKEDPFSESELGGPDVSKLIQDFLKADDIKQEIETKESAELQQPNTNISANSVTLPKSANPGREVGS